MRGLEQELGFALFDRSDSNELTETGMVFLDGMERALEVIDSALERCHALADLREEQDPVVEHIAALLGLRTARYA